MPTTNDAAAFKRSQFKKDLPAFGKCVGTDLSGDFVPAKLAILAADQVENRFADGSSGEVFHRGSLTDFSHPQGRIKGGIEDWRLIAAAKLPRLHRQPKRK
jgi:hypothetical protein